MSFPTNPTTGDIYVYSGKTFRWSGVAWVKIAVSPAITTANVAEVTNLYFTNTRAISALTGGQGVNIAANGLLTGAVQYSNTDVQLYLGNVSGNIVPSANEVYSLGSSDKKWRDLFLSGNTIVLGETKLESSGDGSLAIKSTNVEVTNQISFASNGYIASTAGPVQTAGAVVPKIANILVSDSDYNILDDTAADSQGYIVINGSFFDNQSTVIVGTSSAGSVTFVDSTQLRARLPVLSPGTYPVYVVNSDGATATRVNALNISGFPTWNTASGNLDAVYESIPFSVTLNANSDTNVTYSLYSGLLPTGANLDANTGVLSAANAEITNSNVTYNFTINATDEQLQNTLRSFNFTVVRDEVILNNIANSYIVINAFASSDYYVNATTLSGRGITLAANAIPLGMIIDSANNKITGSPNTVSDVYSIITATSNITNKSNSYNVCFVVQQFALEYIVVAGGGAGGGTGSGGGAGGVLCCCSQLSPGTYSIVVGGGGAATGCTGQGCNGSNSSAFGTTTYGGGGGVSHGAGPGVPGGSGGGASLVLSGSAGVGGRALYGSQGNPGGNSHVNSGWSGGSAGGGGAGATGGVSGPGYSGGGGTGLSVPNFSAIGGSPAGCFGGGGGGAAIYGGCGAGGAGGGGNGQYSGAPGTACTGGGGGGGAFTGGGPYYSWGGNGGSGLVAVRYLISSGCNLTGGTISCSGDYKYHLFCSSGSLVKS